MGSTNGNITPHFLFRNFLTDKRVYHLNQTFWKKEIQKALGKDYLTLKPWVNDTFNNGRPFYDGNPIFSARLSSNKALRIVQEEPESPTVEFGFWTQKTTFGKDHPVEELVIALELSRESQRLALEVIKEWMKE